MKIDVDKFLVREGDAVDLRTMRTLVKPFYRSHKQYTRMLDHHVTKLNALQQLHFASNRHAAVLIFQAMDAAGKDGIIRHVTLCAMRGRPLGCKRKMSLTGVSIAIMCPAC